MDKYSNGWEATANGHSSPRLPTVDEALQYTPFTSIVPCNPDVLPVPAAYPPPSSNVFLDNDEKHAARSLLKALNKQADSTQNASARLQQQLHQVQKLLKQDPPTEYKFKELPNVGKIFQQPVESPATKETEEEKGKRERERKEREKLHIPRPKLGAFTKMALRTVKVPYRYPTPDSPDRQQHGGQQNATAPKKTPQHAQIPSPDPSITAPPSNASRLSPKVKNEVSFPVNGFDVGSAQLTPRPSPGKAAVVVPDLPVASQRTEYEEFPELDAQLEVTGGSVSRKRIHEQPQQGLKALNFNIDQRQKGDEAVEILSQELDNVFEAENEVLATGGNGISVFENQYLSMENIDDTTVAVLVPPTQYKLESAVQKVIALGRMNSIPLDETLRLQKLFGDVVSLANTKDLKIGNEISEADVEEWTLRLETAHSGLLASRNILRVMTACFEEKRIQSEGLVNSILTLLRQVMDSCIIPVVESRASGASAESFRIFSKHQKPLSHLLQAFSRVLKALGDFLSKVDVDESAITTVEALTQGLIFAENAPTEKDAALTIQRFENLRRAAMDVVAKIFFSYSEQRPSIINGILTSLEKLPVTRQSARHFRLAEGKPIQLVSALIMQLIQTSASSSSATNKARKKIPSKDDEGENSGSEESEDDVPLQAQLLRATQIDMGDEASMDVGTMMMSLKDVAHSHYESAFNNAHDVMKYLVRRAMTATKTGDQPYRNLLDIFTEDFISVLGTAEWPAAELLLQVLARHLFSIMKNDKSTVPAQNMALDLMGTLGAGIFNLEDHSRSLHRGLDSSTSEIESSLSQITDEILEENVNDLDALSFNGPTRIVLEFLHSKDLGDSQLMSARGYHVIQWAESLNAAYDIARKTEGRDLEQFKPLASKLRKMVRDLQWLDAEYTFDPVSSSCARLASALQIRNLPFCRFSRPLMTTLLNHLRDDSASLKNRSLKSVTQLLESNPSILDRKDIPILSAFFTCLADNSSQVRDSALTLIGKCLSLRPSMDRSVYNRLVGRCNDTAATVRKRCIKLLKDLYLRNDEEDLRSTIAEAFLQRMTDPDEGVSELARQTFEEIWFTPYHGLRSGTELSAQNKIAFSKHVALIVKTEQRAAAASLEPLLKNVLKKDAKNASSNSNVCKEMVAIMVDAFIDDRAESERPFPVEYLETLAVFAKVGPKLFSAPQLELLRPYVQDITSNDSKRLFRAVLVIYRWVFPYLANMHPDFLKAVFESLLKNVAKLTKVELNEAALCLWTIDSAMKEGSRETIRLSRLMSSTLKGLYDMRQQQIVEDEQSPLYRKARKLLEITGAFGRVCDFDREKSPFKERFAQWNGESVVKLTIDVLHPFLTPQQGSTIRNLALETLCSICKSWPPQYRRGDVMSAIEEVFKGDEPMLKHTVLCGIREFFADEERRSETGAEIAVGEGIVNGSERLGKSLHASENDGVATSLAQYFLQFILKIAKSSQDQIALTATQVVASINRQGLVHPKETGITLVALETSPNNDIATIAYQEHKNLNQKHESVFDKEYMKAVQQSFEYQRYIVKDTRGVIHSPPVSKLRLTFEVLKIGAGKARKKFLANMCSRLDFDLVKLEASHETPIHIMFTRYCVENLALFEYARVDEILHLADCMEKLVATTGSGIAHAIETEVQKVQLELQPVAAGDFPHIDAPYSNEITIDNSSIDEQRLRKLTVASMILSLIWETRTFLRRLWSLQRPRDGGKAKIAIKDLNRPPTKAQGVTPDRYFITINEIMSSLSSRAAQLARCRAFAELLAIDNEHKVASDDEDADLAKAAAGYETPSEDEGDGGNGPPSSKRGKKRKWSTGPAEMPTPSKPKKRGRPSLGSKRKSVDGAGDEE